MPWHLQPTRLTARFFSPSRSFENRDPPDVIAQVDLTADGKAYIHATMSRADGGTAPGVWRGLARQLRALFGVTSLTWDHKRQPSEHETARAGDWVDTVVTEP